eukprot:scaffold3801_cov124-Isochrysis_galbana.AAC.1
MHKSTPLFFCPPFIPLPGLWTDGWGEDAKGAAHQTPLRVLVWHGSNAHSHPLKHHRPCHPPATVTADCAPDCAATDQPMQGRPTAVGLSYGLALAPPLVVLLLPTLQRSPRGR